MKAWSMPIHVFDSLPDRERAEMVADIRIEELLAAHVHHAQKTVSEKENSPPPGKDPYAAFR